MEKLVNRVGSVVTGKYFFDRINETALLTQMIEDGNHVLIVAPRRIGKSSLVKETFLRIREKGEMNTLFVDVQNCGSPEDFIVQLTDDACEYKPLFKKIGERIKSVFGIVESVSAGEVSLKLRESLAGDWQEKGRQIFKILRECDLPMAICFDELPIMITRMLDVSGEHDPSEATLVYVAKRKKADIFLSWLRKEMLRSEEDRLRFVICGSIGLEPVAERHGLTHTINHLCPFRLRPWSRETADDCLGALAANYNIHLSREVKDKMLDYLNPYIPDHVQMFFACLRDDVVSHGKNDPAASDIDRIYDIEMLSRGGHAEFQTYVNRLKTVLGDGVSNTFVTLANTMLAEAAVAGNITLETARRIAESQSTPNPRADCLQIAQTLEHDGYWNRVEGRSCWTFSIPMLRDWWKRHISGKYVSITDEGYQS